MTLNLPDDDGFLMLQRQGDPTQINPVQNWFTELRERMGGN